MILQGYFCSDFEVSMKKVIISLWIVVLLLVEFSALGAAALDSTFNTDRLTDGEKNRIIDNLGLRFVESKPLLPYFSCFDVNDDERLAIGVESLISSDLVAVYDSEGSFQYGYQFDCDGAFHVLWSHDTLNLYLSRSDILLSLDDRGNCIDAQSVDVSDIDNERISRGLIYLRSVVKNGRQYKAELGTGIIQVFQTDFSRLVRVDAQEGRDVLIDCTLSNSLITFFRLLSAVGFIVVFVLVFYKKCLKGLFNEGNNQVNTEK